LSLAVIAAAWPGLQTALEPLIGPLLIVVGLVLLGVQLPLFVVYGLATAVPVALVALAVLYGAQAGGRIVGGVQRWQRPLQTGNACVIVAIGAYSTLSRSLGVL
jgi:hypothetical protein